ncbi:MAG: alpha/beta hydrolase [Flavobacteriia bacterium]|nr:alpha/beta hydrolase [Flavobacteriia bacterium]
MKSLLLIALSFVSLHGFSVQKIKFTENEIILNTKTGDIFGTITTPVKVNKSPIVLIIAGSGPTDRNGNNTMGLHTNAYKMIAESLAMKGISSVRFDKRAIGKSKDAGPKTENDLNFDIYIQDAVEWIQLLQKDDRFSSYYILGHSEGSLIGMIAAQKVKINGFISLAGAGRSADIILKEQLSKQLTPELNQQSNDILDSLKMGKKVEKTPPILASIYRESVQPYMISWMKYDPALELSKLNIPILILQGSTDLQVALSDSELLHKAKLDAKYVVIEKMNHVLKDAESDTQKNMATYYDDKLPLKKEMVVELLKFIQL